MILSVIRELLGSINLCQQAIYIFAMTLSVASVKAFVVHIKRHSHDLVCQKAALGEVASRFKLCSSID